MGIIRATLIRFFFRPISPDPSWAGRSQARQDPNLPHRDAPGWPLSREGSFEMLGCCNVGAGVLGSGQRAVNDQTRLSSRSVIRAIEILDRGNDTMLESVIEAKTKQTTIPRGNSALGPF